VYVPGYSIIFMRDNLRGATTLSIKTFRITILSITDWIVAFKTFSIMTLSISIKSNFAKCRIFLLLCWVSLCWVSLCWVSLCWVSLCWVSWLLLRLVCTIKLYLVYPGIKYCLLNKFLLMHSTEWWHLAGNPYCRGRPSTVDLLIKIGCLVKKISFSFKSSWSELVSTWRSTVLSLLPQLVFPAFSHGQILINLGKI
jgi:hypothetical protein